MKNLYFVIGIVFFSIGFVGIFLPVLPTTPFLIVAVFCFSRSSKKFHDWIVNHPRLGPPVVAWQEHGIIRRRAKVFATVAMACSMTYILFIGDFEEWVKISVALAFAGSLTFIWTRPERAC